MPSLRACGARPSAGGRAGGEALRGSAGDDAKGGFLGGTHSVRPPIRAGRKPGRVTLTDGSARAWWPERGDIWFSVMPSLRACGARPSAGGRAGGRPCGEVPQMTRKAVFSEGRTPCVRVARPHECRGIPFAADGLTMSRWPRGHMPRSSPCPHSGRAEPAP
jgi:hypothetical protein